MSTVVRARWEPTVAGIDVPKRDRRSCVYEAYVPDLVHGRAFAFEGPVTADVSEAEHAIAKLNARATALVDTEAIARLLLRAESVASSRIEGLVGAAEVLANIDAMAVAADAVRDGRPITLDGVLDIHRRLLAPTALRTYGGHLRTNQNWIGGNRYNPCSAAFVPPPPDEVPRLIGDLVAFCNEDSPSAVIQAAIAHAQFETIHPFVDGNGRVGRALIHMILRRRGLAPHVLPPVSLVLATWADRYVDGLTATRYSGEATSTAAHDGINHWVGVFATACKRAVEDANVFEDRVAEMQRDWRARVGEVRADSGTAILLHKLPGATIITVQSAAELIGRSIQAANEAVSRLLEAGVLIQSRVGRRNRAFEARDVIDAFTDLERRLASPAGDTRVSPPERPVPYRRRKSARPRK